MNPFGVDAHEISKAANRPTKAERKRVSRAENAGAWGGAVGGATLGYKGVKGAGRAHRGARAGKSSYGFSRGLSTVTQGGGGRLKDLGTAARTGISTAVKAPKSRASLGAIAGGYGGWMAGAIGGSAGASSHARKKNARLRSEAVGKSAFGVEHGGDV